MVWGCLATQFQRKRGLGKVHSTSVGVFPSCFNTTEHQSTKKTQIKEFSMEKLVQLVQIMDLNRIEVLQDELELRL